MKYTLTTILLFMGFSMFTYGQEVISTQGEEYTGSDLSLTFTIGEVVIDTYDGTNFTLTQGFHQPLLDFTTGITFTELSGISVYPNPTADFISLNLQQLEDDLVYELYDTKGRLFAKQDIENVNTIVDFKEFASGAYILLIRDKQANKFNTYQIIKE